MFTVKVVDIDLVIVNLVITALNLKLYTEILKDRKQDDRARK